MACEFEVKILGKKGHSHWEYNGGNRLLFYSTYAPLSEDANRELITQLAEAVGINKSKIHLVHGVENELKLFKITDKDIDFDAVLEGLDLVEREEEF